MTDPRAAIPDADFVRHFEEHGPHHLSKAINISLKSIYNRRRALEHKLRRQIVAPGANGTRVGIAHPGRIDVELADGVVLVGSDCHYWPGPASTAHRAFVKFCKELRPKIVVLNGDVIDATAISRHPPIGWTHMPTVQEEIEAAQDRLAEIEATFKTRKVWTLGNHDARFETRLATIAREYAKVHGTSLKDHFPNWEPCWSVTINNDVHIKHRYKGGIHATHNNAVNAGRSIVTSHLHGAKVTPVTDYNGTRYGVDTGCIADPWHPAFAYLEDNPRNWRSGFAVLTFRAGKLMMPELVLVWDEDHVEFRGEIRGV